jgi:small-conductance mechanosensitive channel
MVQTGAVATIGALVTRVALRNHPTRRLVCQLAFFAALTALLLYHGIVPHEAGPPGASSLERVFIGLAKVIWWINAAWFLISVVRVFLIIEGQPREGRLVQDLVVGLIYLGATLSVVAYVFDAPVGTLIATSGVVAIILGLAMQSTLSDVFSGIALNLGRPYSIGDWIELGDGIDGRVVETNWRATHLLNGLNDLVIVPNSGLAKARLTNLSSPERSHGITIAVRLAPTRPPAAMIDVMRSESAAAAFTIRMGQFGFVIGPLSSRNSAGREDPIKLPLSQYTVARALSARTVASCACRKGRSSEAPERPPSSK